MGRPGQKISDRVVGVRLWRGRSVSYQNTEVNLQWPIIQMSRRLSKKYSFLLRAAENIALETINERKRTHFLDPQNWKRAEAFQL